MADPEPLWVHNTSMPLWGGLIMASMLPKTQAIEHASQQEPHQNFFDEVGLDPRHALSFRSGSLHRG